MLVTEKPHAEDLISSFLPIVRVYFDPYRLDFLLYVNRVPLAGALHVALSYLPIR